MRRLGIISLYFAVVFALGLAFVLPAHGDEGTGTPDFCYRHGCGEPAGETTSTTTTTTLPTVCICNGTTIEVSCPEYNPVPYVPCRDTKHGLTCPRKATPHRVLMPIQ